MDSFVAIAEGFVRDSFFPEENLVLANSMGNTRFIKGKDLPSPEEIALNLPGMDAYVTAWGSPRLDETLLQKADSLRLLVHLCGTVVPFVSDAMWDRGIRVISGNDYFAESVAEGVVAYLLTALRDIPRHLSDLKEKHLWKPAPASNEGLLDKTVGLVSYGTVAKHTARLLHAFRCKLLVYDIVPVPEEDRKKYGITQVSLEEVFRESDIVSVHTAYNAGTHHMIGKAHFDLLRSGSLFLNTSRGGVLDEAALADTLKKRDFRAFLDVYEEEPPAKDNPLFALPNVYMMPHMGGPTTDRRKYITAALLKEADAFLRGEGSLPHEISRDAASRMSKS